MANSWLRLWHDFPDDPKWRTISRIAHEPISTVQAVYLRLMVSASQADPRGEARINPVVTADALDIEAESVIRIIEAMQGLVMDGDQLTGWERRQPAQEDSSAARTKRWRERKNGDGHISSRDDLSVSVTQPIRDHSPFRQ
jgi:hypothetical protein